MQKTNLKKAHPRKEIDGVTSAIVREVSIEGCVNTISEHRLNFYPFRVGKNRPNRIVNRRSAKITNGDFGIVGNNSFDLKAN